MNLTNNIMDVMGNTMRFIINHGQTLPSYVKERLVELTGPNISAADFSVKVSELLYTIADDLNSEGLEVLAQNAFLAADGNYHGMMERGTRMVNAARRKAGEETIQLIADDPEINEEYIEPSLRYRNVPDMYASSLPMQLKEENIIKPASPNQA